MNWHYIAYLLQNSGKRCFRKWKNLVTTDTTKKNLNNENIFYAFFLEKYLKYK